MVIRKFTKLKIGPYHLVDAYIHTCLIDPHNTEMNVCRM